jgi:hypothetical protein
MKIKVYNSHVISATDGEFKHPLFELVKCMDIINES